MDKDIAISVENVTMCEIDGKAVEICKKYLPTIACELDNPKVNVVIGDGVEFIKNKKNMYFSEKKALLRFCSSAF